MIKYIVKSKVLCWCRRQEFGGRIPVEAAMLYDLVSIPHPHIPRLITCFQDDFYVYIVMPYTPVQDLFDYIESNADIPEADIKRIFYQTCQAVKHLHTNGIIHRDIKVQLT